MVSPNDHVVMNHQNQTTNKWHIRPCSLQRAHCQQEGPPSACADQVQVAVIVYE
jgi:hypothetical protein